MITSRVLSLFLFGVTSYSVTVTAKPVSHQQHVRTARGKEEEDGRELAPADEVCDLIAERIDAEPGVDVQTACTYFPQLPVRCPLLCALPQATIRIVQTGDYVLGDVISTSRGEIVPFAEPYKVTTLEATNLDVDIDDTDEIIWSIQFVPRDDEIWPEYQLELVDAEVDGYTIIGTGTTVEHMFKLPGTYKIGLSTIAKSVLMDDKTIRVAYARRDVIDLSPTDWTNYVDALWTLKNLSTAEGQSRYGPTFYNVDVFTTMHHVNSINQTCDQIHFSLMQEFAHQSWMTLLEKALQSVHPSVALPWYNIAKDFSTYYDPDVGVKSMLDSPIYGNDYYGAGYANWDDRDNIYDPYYLEDGAFAKFPLRQNRTELCEESAGIFDDDIYIPFCKKVMEEFDIYKGWVSSDPTTTGIWHVEPREVSAHDYVSARRWYVYELEKSVVDRFPDYSVITGLKTYTDATALMSYMGGSPIHGFGHIGLGGMWGGGITNETQTTTGLNVLEYLEEDDYFFSSFAFYDEVYTRVLGCYECDRDGCFLNEENAREVNCYNIEGNFFIPFDVTEPYWTDAAVNGTLWYNHLIEFNLGSWTKYALYGLEATHPNGGTFARHSCANQDPMFYVHHAFTFATLDYGLNSLVDRGIASAPFYGIFEAIEDRGVPECPGNNGDDTVVFRNLVRYKTGKEPGTSHTWKEILEMWGPERRDFEWILNDENW